MIYNYNICVVLLYCKMFKSTVESEQPQFTFKDLMDAFSECRHPYDDPEEDIDPFLLKCLQTRFTEITLSVMMGEHANEYVSIHSMLSHLLQFLLSGETYIENFLMCVKEIKKFTPTEQEKNIIDEIRKLHKHIEAQRVSTGKLCSDRHNYMTLGTGYLTSSRQNHWKNIFVKIFTQCDIIAKLIASYNQKE